MLNYSIEVERFDTHVGELLAELEASGEAENTLSSSLRPRNAVSRVKAHL